jgi:dUTPase
VLSFCGSAYFQVGVILFNHGDADFQIKVGDRVAQLILERIAIAEVQEVHDLDATYAQHIYICIVSLCVCV